MDNNDDATIMLCAMRYALGRKTYMPGIIQDYIRSHKDKLDYQTVCIMISDICEADKIKEYTLSNGEVVKVDGLGDSRIDRPGWLRFCEWLVKLMKEMKENG